MKSIEHHDGHVRAGRITKIMTLLCVTVYWVAVIVSMETKGYAFDEVRRGSATGIFNLYYGALLIAWGAMWLASLYLCVLALRSMRAGAFPYDSALLPIASRQYKGRTAYALCLLALVAAASLFYGPISEKRLADRELQQVKNLRPIELPWKH